MTSLERKEMEALEFAGLTAMPEEYNPEGPVWVRAIAKVQTQMNSHSYVVVQNDAAENPKIVRVFDACGVAKYEAIYPYEFLDAGAMPAVKDVNDARAAVVNLYGADPEEVEKLTKKQLISLLLRYALRRQIRLGKGVAAPVKTEEDNDNENTEENDE